MKQYVIFTVSFILLFAVVFIAAEVLFGMYLTAVYLPDIDEAWTQSGELSAEVSLISNRQPFVLTLLPGLIAATGAYFIVEKTANNKLMNDGQRR